MRNNVHVYLLFLVINLVSSATRADCGIGKSCGTYCCGSDQTSFVGSHKSNGVSALHTGLMGQTVFRDLNRNNKRDRLARA